jgi:hypothetical protein
MRFSQISCATKKWGIKVTRPKPTIIRKKPSRFICPKNKTQYMNTHNAMPLIKAVIGANLVR